MPVFFAVNLQAKGDPALGRAIAVALLSAASAAFASIQRIGEPSVVDALSSMTCARTVMDHCLLSSEAAGRGEEHGPAAANPAAGGGGLTGYANHR